MGRCRPRPQRRTRRYHPVILPANLRFAASAFVDTGSGQVVADIQNAIASGQWAFDGSDAMPSGIDDAKGAFLEGMVRLVTKATPENLDRLSLEITQDIENVWVALEEARG